MANLKLKIVRGNTTSWLRCFSPADAEKMISRIHSEHRAAMERFYADENAEMPAEPRVKLLNVGQKV